MIPAPRRRQWSTVLASAFAVGVLIYFTAARLHTFPPWAVFLAVFALTVLIMVPGVYAATLARIHENALFNREGWLFRLRTRRLLITLRWLLWGLASAYFMLLQLNLYTWQEWLLFFANFPLFFVLFSGVHALLREHAHPVHRLRFALAWTRWLLPVTMALLAGLVVWQADSDGSPPKSLRETIEEKREHMSGAPSSAVVDESLHIISLVAGLREHSEALVASLSVQLGRAFTIASTAFVSFNVGLVLSCLSIPSTEYRRLFGPMSDDLVPPQLVASQVATFVAVVTVLSLFIFLQGFAALEAHLQRAASFAEVRRAVETEIVVQVDKVGDALYKPGTIDQIERAREDLFRQVAEAVPDLERQIDEAFAIMESNVEPFLDWYYGLAAEYMRLGSILTGNLEAMLQRELREHLLRNDAFAAVQEKLQQVLAVQKAALEDFETRRTRLLADNRLDSVGSNYRVLKHVSFDELQFLPAPPVHVDAEYRLGGAGTAGAVTGVVAAKVVSKSVAKGVIKMAATAASKLVASKAASSAVGAAAGAAIGSVVPGVGTAIGAIAGFLIGLGSGVAVDAALLKLEEHLSRDAFRSQIMDSIAEARTEFKTKVFARQ